MPMNYYLVLDLEATCCDANTVPRGEMEIIEFGAVMVDSESLDLVSQFQSFVRPVRHPVLTQFCRELTSIRQSDVDSVPGLPAVLAKLKNWADGFPGYVVCSWGDYDRRQLLQDCLFHRVPMPFTCEHINLKKKFSEFLGTKKRFGMAGALRKLGLPLGGTHHRGIDDARNIARILRVIMRSGKYGGLPRPLVW